MFDVTRTEKKNRQGRCLFYKKKLIYYHVVKSLGFEKHLHTLHLCAPQKKIDEASNGLS